jgi:hypothetical protein
MQIIAHQPKGLQNTKLSKDVYFTLLLPRFGECGRMASEGLLMGVRAEVGAAESDRFGQRFSASSGTRRPGFPLAV